MSFRKLASADFGMMVACLSLSLAEPCNDRPLQGLLGGLLPVPWCSCCFALSG
jgi:hypothetical protein